MTTFVLKSLSFDDDASIIVSGWLSNNFSLSAISQRLETRAILQTHFLLLLEQKLEQNIVGLDCGDKYYGTLSQCPNLGIIRLNQSRVWQITF
jgi:hypothetical protein